MIKKIFILLCIAFSIALPFVLKRNEVTLIPENPDDVIVIITAHNESLRGEYGRGFTEWYKKKTGKVVTIDWRHPGGGREVSRYVDSVFTNNFRSYWENDLKKQWTQKVRSIFSQLESIKNPIEGSLEFEIRDAFLKSNVGCGVDLLFGGGVFDHKVQAAKGYTIPNGLIEKIPELFSNDAIPEFFAGERLWDANGHWIGSSLTSFGIIYNSDAIKSLGIHPPETWMDLADDKYIGNIAIVDPTKSSSTLKSYDMLIQQQMQIAYARLNAENLSENDRENLAIREGWLEGLKLIQKIVANGRYMTDSSAQTVIDVSDGNCPVGIATDFYGYSEKSHIKLRKADPRFHFVIPRAGSSPSPDPISLYRGAIHKELALEFLEYVLTLPGQQLLANKVGTPNGPAQSPLCRSPILKTVYQPQFLQYFDDPELNPYADAGDFVYREKWIKDMQNSLGLIFKMAFVNPESRLQNAWKCIQNAYKEGRVDDAENALAVMQDLSLFDYDTVMTKIKAEVRNKDYLSAIRYQTDISNHFRNQYKKASKIAKGK